MRAIYFGSRKKPWPRENRRAHVEEIETGQLLGEIEIRIEEASNRSDVFPITLEDVGEDAMTLDRPRNDVLAEIRLVIVQQLDHHVAVEDVDTHGREEKFVLSFDFKFLVKRTLDLQGIQHGIFLRFFDEAGDAMF